jgi:hypothetical protein
LRSLVWLPKSSITVKNLAEEGVLCNTDSPSLKNPQTVEQLISFCRNSLLYHHDAWSSSKSEVSGFLLPAVPGRLVRNQQINTY